MYISPVLILCFTFHDDDKSKFDYRTSRTGFIICLRTRVYLSRIPKGIGTWRRFDRIGADQ
jgi:hypothetical protein